MLFHTHRNGHAGFTIVELLIVIVVIAILAAITVVAFNGIQERAKYTAVRSTFNAAKKAIELYHADTGEYPNSANCTGFADHGWCGWDQGTNDSFIPGIAPMYVSSVANLDTSLPKPDTLLYQSRNSLGTAPGTAQYELIRFRNVDGAGLSAYEKSNASGLMTTDGYQSGNTNYGWGYRSNPASSWW